MKSNHITNVALSAVQVPTAVSLQSLVRLHAVRLMLSDKRLKVHTPEKRGGRKSDYSPDCVCLTAEECQLRCPDSLCSDSPRPVIKSPLFSDF